ncbi:MAG: MarR family winged helix-turn-helix transcriptional regulator, partial [Sulfitobacter sp.]
KRAYVIVQKDFRAVMGDGGMSGRVFSALSFIAGMPGITQSDLARNLGIERSGLVAIIDELEAAKFVRRLAVPGDRRVQALHPTAIGEKAYAEAVAKVQLHEDRLLSFLSDTEKKQLVKLLQKIRKSEGEAK